MKKLLILILFATSMHASFAQPGAQTSPGIIKAGGGISLAALKQDTTYTQGITRSALRSLPITTLPNNRFTFTDPQDGGTVARISGTSSGFHDDSVFTFITTAGEVYRRVDTTVARAPWLCKGDGVTNDSLMMATLLRHKYVDLGTGVYYLGKGVGASMDGQNVYSNGYGTILLDSTGTFGANGKRDVVIAGITIKGGNGRKCYGIYADTCVNLKIINVTFKNCALGAYIRRSQTTTIDHCLFLDAPVDTRFFYNGHYFASAGDIDIEGNTQGIKIVDNIFRSANSYGIQVRSDSNFQISDVDIERNNIDSSYTVGAYNSYGIILYHHKNPPSTTDGRQILRVKILNNTVRHISGQRPNTIGGSDLIFGAGIYIQGAENGDVSYNTVAYTNGFTNNPLLAPGGIGGANTGGFRYSHNIIDSCSLNGVNVNNSTFFGDSLARTVIDNNSISNCQGAGIKTVAQANLYAILNQIRRCGVGISITNGSSGQYIPNLYIWDNRVDSSVTSNCGIDHVVNASVLRNFFNGAGTDGLNLANVINAAIERNTMQFSPSRGVILASTVTGDVYFNYNRVKYNNLGVAVGAPLFYGINFVDSNTTNFSGNYFPGSKADTTTSTPSVKGATFLSISTVNPLTVNKLLDGYIGQVVTFDVQSSNTITFHHNASGAGNIFLLGSSDLTMASNSTLSLQYNGVTWKEIARKDDNFQLKQIDIYGTSGAGFIHLLNQGLVPPTPASGIDFYGSQYGPAWVNTNGFAAIVNTNSNTAARTYAFPDKNGTVAMLSDVTGAPGAFTVGAAVTTPSNANGLIYSGGILTGVYADASNPGLLAPTAQSFGTGTKTTGILQPSANNTYTLGNSTTGWSTIYGQTYSSVGAATILNSPSGFGINLNINGTTYASIGTTGHFAIRHGGGNGSAPSTGTLGTNVTSATVTGTDDNCSIVVVTSGAVSGNICTITFAAGWTATPNCVAIVNSNSTTAGASSQMYCAGASSTTATFGGILSAAGTYTYTLSFRK